MLLWLKFLRYKPSPLPSPASGRGSWFIPVPTIQMSPLMSRVCAKSPDELLPFYTYIFPNERLSKTGKFTKILYSRAWFKLNYPTFGLLLHASSVVMDWDFSSGISHRRSLWERHVFYLYPSYGTVFLWLLCKDYFRPEIKFFLSPRKFFAGNGLRWGGTSYISKSNFEFKNGICPIIDLCTSSTNRMKSQNFL